MPATPDAGQAYQLPSALVDRLAPVSRPPVGKLSDVGYQGLQPVRKIATPRDRGKLRDEPRGRLAASWKAGADLARWPQVEQAVSRRVRPPATSAMRPRARASGAASRRRHEQQDRCRHRRHRRHRCHRGSRPAPDGRYRRAGRALARQGGGTRAGAGGGAGRGRLREARRGAPGGGRDEREVRRMLDPRHATSLRRMEAKRQFVLPLTEPAASFSLTDVLWEAQSSLGTSTRQIRFSW